MEERGWAYRRRQPEGMVLYEVVRDHLATLLAEANEAWHAPVRGAGLRQVSGVRILNNLGHMAALAGTGLPNAAQLSDRLGRTTVGRGCRQGPL